MNNQEPQQQPANQSINLPYILWLSINGFTWIPIFFASLPHLKDLFEIFDNSLYFFIPFILALAFFVITKITIFNLWRKNEQHPIHRLFYSSLVVGIVINLLYIFPLSILNYSEYTQDFSLLYDYFILFGTLVVSIILGFKALRKSKYTKIIP